MIGFRMVHSLYEDHDQRITLGDDLRRLALRIEKLEEELLRRYSDDKGGYLLDSMFAGRRVLNDAYGKVDFAVRLLNTRKIDQAREQIVEGIELLDTVCTKLEEEKSKLPRVETNIGELGSIKEGIRSILGRIDQG